jgi:tRNA threonylcarbamoyl adenosine modification protein YjeE
VHLLPPFAPARQDDGGAKATQPRDAAIARIAGSPVSVLKRGAVDAASALALALADEDATAALAARLAACARAGDVIALAGPLGSGKTSFARAFIRARLGHPVEVPSPTFTLVEIYEGAGPAIWHFDLFRLKAPEETWELGLEDALAEGITLIEWPERLGRLLPAERLVITLAFGPAEAARVATIDPSPAWSSRLAGLASTSCAHSTARLRRSAQGEAK